MRKMAQDTDVRYNMKIVDLEPQIPSYKPTQNVYEIYTYIHANYEDDDEPYGPQRADLRMIVNNKIDAISAMNDLNELYLYILSEPTINRVKYEPLRQQLMDVYVNREDGDQLFLAKSAVVYYDEFGRKCRVNLKEE